MTPSQLNRAIAAATGESLCEIRRRGFGIADPDRVAFDPEPHDLPAQTVDWDQLDSNRVVLFP